MVGTAVLVTLASVLVAAALGKRRDAPLLAGAEGALAVSVIVLPGWIAAAALALTFAGFTVAHARDLRAGLLGCDCFGAGARAGASPERAAGITAGSAAAALVVALVGAPSLLALVAHRPSTAVVVVAAAAVAGVVWRIAFSVRADRPDALAASLVRASAFALERRFTRRSLLERVALVGTALAVAPLRYLLYPGTAMAAITPGDCSTGLCLDGYTAFCCQINNGLNSCPEGTFPGGWWMCTDYAGTMLCADQGVRYYVDCNALPGREYPGGCQCAGGTCDERRVACNVFRYGQCNVQIAGVTAVVCRMVLCENPSMVPALGCSGSVAVDDAVCDHEAPCLMPPARQLAGAGGV